MYCSFLHYSMLSFLMRNHVLPDNSLCFAQLNLFRLGAVGNLKMYRVRFLSFLLYVSNQNYSHVYLMPREKIRRKSGRNKHTVFIHTVHLQGNVIEMPIEHTPKWKKVPSDINVTTMKMKVLTYGKHAHCRINGWLCSVRCLRHW